MILQYKETLDEERRDVPYLDMRGIQEYVPLKAVAYLTDGKAGLTKMDSGFVTFYLKDVNANTVVGRMFDVKDFLVSGVNIAMLKKKPVQISFVAQSFNGSISLIVDSLEVYTGKFDYNKFIGEIKYDVSAAVETGRELFGRDWDIPAVWKHASFEEFGKGRIGGFVKVFEIAFGTLSMFTGLSSVSREEFIQTFYNSMKEYFNLLTFRAKMDNLQSLTIHDMLHELCRAYGEEEKLLIADTVKALAGLSKPLHLYSHLICLAVGSARQAVDLSIMYETLPTGSKISLGGGADLLKY